MTPGCKRAVPLPCRWHELRMPESTPASAPGPSSPTAFVAASPRVLKRARCGSGAWSKSSRRCSMRSVLKLASIAPSTIPGARCTAATTFRSSCWACSTRCLCLCACAASGLRRTRQALGTSPVSLGSFSEAQSLLSRSCSRRCSAGLVADSPAGAASQIGGVDLACLRVVDSTPVACPATATGPPGAAAAPAINSMACASTKYRLADGVPVAGICSGGKLCERKALRQQAQGRGVLHRRPLLRPEHGFLEEPTRAADTSCASSRTRSSCRRSTAVSSAPGPWRLRRVPG